VLPVVVMSQLALPVVYPDMMLAQTAQNKKPRRFVAWVFSFLPVQ
jgi:hypothetical protein